MDVTDLVDAVREANNTELSRLGSSKSLYADTAGEMDAGAVLAAMADATHYLAETADGWTTDDDGYADTYGTVAETERDHYDAIAADLEAHDPGDRPAALEVLRGFENPLSRLGGLLGWTLVVEAKASQATGFFTGQADPQTASTFRAFGDDYEDLRGAIVDAVETAAATEDVDDALAESGDDVEYAVDQGEADTDSPTSAMDDEPGPDHPEIRDPDALDAARAAADAVVGAAYDEYVDRLEAQGVNPKPVC
ncbi:rubrerythrin family protein [Halobacteriales archaeon Cl-PHB]